MTYSLYHLWTPLPGAKTQQPGCHRATYWEHLKEQASAAPRLAQVELYMLLSHNRTTAVAIQFPVWVSWLMKYHWFLSSLYSTTRYSKLRVSNTQSPSSPSTLSKRATPLIYDGRLSSWDHSIWNGLNDNTLLDCISLLPLASVSIVQETWPNVTPW